MILRSGCSQSDSAVCKGGLLVLWCTDDSQMIDKQSGNVADVLLHEHDRSGRKGGAREDIDPSGGT